MAQLSQSGQLGFRTQAARGLFLDPGAGGAFMRLRSGAMGGDRELQETDPEIGGGRDRTGATLGPIAYAGEYEAYARFEAIATLLQGVLGAGSSVVTGTAGLDQVGTHTITPINDTNLPWISVEEAIGQSFDVFQYTDARVDTFSMEADADGQLMVTAGMLALEQQAGGVRTDLTGALGELVDTTPLIVGSEITVLHNGLSLCAKSFSLEISNNIEDDDFCLGSISADDLTPKAREIEMGLSIRPEDSALWREARYGSAAAVTAQSGEAARSPVQVTITSATNIPGTSTPYSLTVDIPVSVIRPFEVSPSGDDIIETDLELVALAPDPTVDIIEIGVVNGIDSIR